MIAAILSEVATPPMMPPVIIRTSKNLADAVIGAPVIASWTEPTSESPDSNTVTPAAITSDGEMLMFSWSWKLNRVMAGVAATNPPTNC